MTLTVCWGIHLSSLCLHHGWWIMHTRSLWLHPSMLKACTGTRTLTFAPIHCLCIRQSVFSSACLMSNRSEAEGLQSFYQFKGTQPRDCRPRTASTTQTVTPQQTRAHTRRACTHSWTRACVRACETFWLPSRPGKRLKWCVSRSGVYRVKRRRPGRLKIAEVWHQVKKKSFSVYDFFFFCFVIPFFISSFYSFWLLPLASIIPVHSNWLRFFSRCTSCHLQKRSRTCPPVVG